MAEITLTNASRSITLHHVMIYIITGRDDYAVKGIPGKSTGTVDTDTFVVHPWVFDLNSVRLTAAEKAIIILMRSDKLDITLNDGEDNYTVRMNQPIFRADPGNTRMPWIMDVRLMSTS